MTGTLKVVSPSPARAVTSAHPMNTPITRPSSAPWMAMMTDSQRIADRSWARVIPTARRTPSSRVRSTIDRASVLPIPSRAMMIARASMA